MTFYLECFCRIGIMDQMSRHTDNCQKCRDAGQQLPKGWVVLRGTEQEDTAKIFRYLERGMVKT